MNPHIAVPNSQRIRAGELSNGRFLGVLGSLGDRWPEVVSEKFLFGANPAHYYCLRVFVNGE